MSCMRIFKLTPKKVMNYRKTLRKRGRMLESEQNSKKGLATYHMYVTHKYRVFSVTFTAKVGPLSKN